MSTPANATTTGAASPARADLSHLTFLMHPALALLWQARELATEAFGDPDCEEAWQFAPQLTDLMALGLTEPQLSLLRVQKFVNCRSTTSGAVDEVGVTWRSDFPRVMLLRKGAAALQEMLRACYRSRFDCLPQCYIGSTIVLDESVRPSEGSTDRPEGRNIQSMMILEDSFNRFGTLHDDTQPWYDIGRRELWCGSHLVKRFKTPAKNQELVLHVFQEEGWPPRIDDPLPPSHGIEPKSRLRDTIAVLNRHHLSPRIRFHGDGWGTGVRWQALRNQCLP